MNIDLNTVVSFEGKLTLTESELRALEALVGYGTDNFLTVFYGKLGKAYLQPHEAGLRSLFKTINVNVPTQLRRIDAARKVLATGLVKPGDMK